MVDATQLLKYPVLKMNNQELDPQTCTQLELLNSLSVHVIKFTRIIVSKTE